MVNINNNKTSEFYKSKSVLITGGSDYIGSHIINSLLKEDCKISCFKRNKDILKKNDIKYIFGDYDDQNVWNEVIKDADLIFLLVAQIIIFTTQKVPGLDDIANLKLLEVLLKTFVKKKKLAFIN
tara:strand:+ start:1818 stop:2192 length:375 start_codon:yes stop_codon:yes gene_type:complete